MILTKAPLEVKKPSDVEFSVMAANVVFLSYDASFLNKWEIHTESATGRSSITEVLCSWKVLYYLAKALSAFSISYSLWRSFI